jgi:serine/threonine protein kinase
MLGADDAGVDSHILPGDDADTRAKKKHIAEKKAALQRVGSVPWMAPELYERRPRYSPASDVYSLAITLGELASRELPFADADNPSMIPKWVSEGQRPDLPANCQGEFRMIIEACWNQDPAARPHTEVLSGMLERLCDSYPVEEESMNAIMSKMKASGFHVGRQGPSSRAQSSGRYGRSSVIGANSGGGVNSGNGQSSGNSGINFQQPAAGAQPAAPPPFMSGAVIPHYDASESSSAAPAATAAPQETFQMPPGYESVACFDNGKPKAAAEDEAAAEPEEPSPAPAAASTSPALPPGYESAANFDNSK